MANLNLPIAPIQKSVDAARAQNLPTQDAATLADSITQLNKAVKSNPITPKPTTPTTTKTPTATTPATSNAAGVSSALPERKFRFNNAGDVFSSREEFEAAKKATGPRISIGKQAAAGGVDATLNTSPLKAARGLKAGALYNAASMRELKANDPEAYYEARAKATTGALKDEFIEEAKANQSALREDAAEVKAKAQEASKKFQNTRTALEWAADTTGSEGLKNLDTKVKKFIDTQRTALEEEDNPIDKFIGQLAYSGGRMVPSMLIGKAVGSAVTSLAAPADVAAFGVPESAINAGQVAASYAVAPTIFTQVYNSEADTLIKSGVPDEVAYKRAFGSALVEAGTEMFVGGMPGFGEGIIDPSISKLANNLADYGDIVLKDGTSVALIGGWGNAAAQALATVGEWLKSPAGKFAVDIFGEGFEEVAADLLEPIINRGVLGSAYTSSMNLTPQEMNELFDTNLPSGIDVIQSFASGALLSLVSNGMAEFGRSLGQRNKIIKVDEETGKATILDSPTPLTPTQQMENAQAMSILMRKWVMEGLTADEAKSIGVGEAGKTPLFNVLNQFVEDTKSGAISTPEQAADYIQRVLLPAAQQYQQMKEQAVAAREFPDSVNKMQNVGWKVEQGQTNLEALKTAVAKGETQNIPKSVLKGYANWTMQELINRTGRVAYKDDKGTRMLSLEEFARVANKGTALKDLSSEQKEKTITAFKTLQRTTRDAITSQAKEQAAKFGINDVRVLSAAEYAKLERSKASLSSYKDNVIYINGDAVASTDVAAILVAHEMWHAAQGTDPIRFDSIVQRMMDATGLDYTAWYNDIKADPAYAQADDAEIRGEVDARFLSYALTDLSTLNEIADSDMRDALKGIVDFTSSVIDSTPQNTELNSAMRAVRSDAQSALNGTLDEKIAESTTHVPDPTFLVAAEEADLISTIRRLSNEMAVEADPEVVKAKGQEYDTAVKEYIRRHPDTDLSEIFAVQEPPKKKPTTKKATTKKSGPKKAETKKSAPKNPVEEVITEAPKVETKKAETKKAETKKAETKKAETKKATPKNPVDGIIVEASKAETKKAETKKAETKKAETKKAEAPKEKALAEMSQEEFDAKWKSMQKSAPEVEETLKKTETKKAETKKSTTKKSTKAKNAAEEVFTPKAEEPATSAVEEPVAPATEEVVEPEAGEVATAPGTEVIINAEGPHTGKTGVIADGYTGGDKVPVRLNVYGSERVLTFNAADLSAVSGEPINTAETPAEEPVATEPQTKEEAVQEAVQEVPSIRDNVSTAEIKSSQTARALINVLNKAVEGKPVPTTIRSYTASGPENFDRNFNQWLSKIKDYGFVDTGSYLVAADMLSRVGGTEYEAAAVQAVQAALDERMALEDRAREVAAAEAAARAERNTAQLPEAAKNAPAEPAPEEKRAAERKFKKSLAEVQALLGSVDSAPFFEDEDGLFKNTVAFRTKDKSNEPQITVVAFKNAEAAAARDLTQRRSFTRAEQAWLGSTYKRGYHFHEDRDIFDGIPGENGKRRKKVFSHPVTKNMWESIVQGNDAVFKLAIRGMEPDEMPFAEYDFTYDGQEFPGFRIIFVPAENGARAQFRIIQVGQNRQRIRLKDGRTFIQGQKDYETYYKQPELWATKKPVSDFLVLQNALRKTGWKYQKQGTSGDKPYGFVIDIDEPDALDGIYSSLLNHSEEELRAANDRLAQSLKDALYTPEEIQRGERLAYRRRMDEDAKQAALSDKRFYGPDYSAANEAEWEASKQEESRQKSERYYAKEAENDIANGRKPVLSPADALRKMLDPRHRTPSIAPEDASTATEEPQMRNLRVNPETGDVFTTPETRTKTQWFSRVADDGRRADPDKHIILKYRNNPNWMFYNNSIFNELIGGTLPKDVADRLDIDPEEFGLKDLSGVKDKLKELAVKQRSDIVARLSRLAELRRDAIADYQSAKSQPGLTPEQAEELERENFNRLKNIDNLQFRFKDALEDLDNYSAKADDWAQALINDQRRKKFDALKELLFGGFPETTEVPEKIAAYDQRTKSFITIAIAHDVGNGVQYEITNKGLRWIAEHRSEFSGLDVQDDLEAYAASLVKEDEGKLSSKIREEIKLNLGEINSSASKRMNRTQLRTLNAILEGNYIDVVEPILNKARELKEKAEEADAARAAAKAEFLSQEGLSDLNSLTPEQLSKAWAELRPTPANKEGEGENAAQIIADREREAIESGNAERIKAAEDEAFNRPVRVQSEVTEYNLGDFDEMTKKQLKNLSEEDKARYDEIQGIKERLNPGFIPKEELDTFEYERRVKAEENRKKIEAAGKRGKTAKASAVSDERYDVPELNESTKSLQAALKQGKTYDDWYDEYYGTREVAEAAVPGYEDSAIGGSVYYQGVGKKVEETYGPYGAAYSFSLDQPRVPGSTSKFYVDIKTPVRAYTKILEGDAATFVDLVKKELGDAAQNVPELSGTAEGRDAQNKELLAKIKELQPIAKTPEGSAQLKALLDQRDALNRALTPEEYAQYLSSGQAELLTELKRLSQLAYPGVRDQQAATAASDFIRNMVQNLGYDGIIDNGSVRVYNENQFKPSTGKDFAVTEDDVLNLMGNLPEFDGSAYDAFVKEYPYLDEEVFKASSAPAKEPTTQARVASTRSISSDEISEITKSSMRDMHVGEEQYERMDAMVAAGELGDYETASDKKALQYAENMLAGHTLAESYRLWKADYEANGIGNKNKEVWAIKLYEALSDAYADARAKGQDAEGLFKALIDVQLSFQEAGTNAAQMVQGFNLMDVLNDTPGGTLYYTERWLKNINKRLSAKGAKVDLKLSDSLRKDLLNATTPEERSKALWKVADYVAENTPFSFRRWADSIRYLAMLSAPTTHIRNFLSNGVNTIMFIAKDVAAGAAEDIYYDVFAKDKSKKTKSLKGMLFPKQVMGEAQWQALKDFTKQELALPEVANRLTAYGKYSNKNETASMLDKYYDEAYSPLKTKVGRMASTTVSNALEAADRIALNLNFTMAFQQFCVARGLTAEHLQQSVAGNKQAIADLNAALSYAIKEAQDATYRSPSKLAEWLNKGKQVPGWGLAIDSLMPFTRTPINVAKTGLRFSPASLLIKFPQELMKAAQVKAQGGDPTTYINSAIDRAATGLIGSGIALLGYMLASAGRLKGAGSGDDREDYYNQSLGEQHYSISFADGSSYTMDWLTPASMTLFAGVELYDRVQQLIEDGEFAGTPEEITGVVADMLMHLTDPMLEMSFMQGVQNTIKGVRYAETGGEMFGSIASNLATSYAAQFAPTIGAKVESIFDPAVGSTYAPSDSLWQAGERTGRQVLNKIPGLSEEVNAPSRDYWGNVKTNSLSGKASGRNAGEFVGDAFYTLLSPGYYRKGKATEVDNYLKKLSKQVGDVKVLPNAQPKRFEIRLEDGGKDEKGNPTYAPSKTFQLNNAEYSTYSKVIGETRNEVITQMLNSGLLDTLSPEKQAAVISDVYSYANSVGRDRYAESKGYKYKMPDEIKEADNATKAGLTVGEYFIIKEALRDPSRKKSADKGAFLRQIGLSRKQRAVFE